MLNKENKLFSLFFFNSSTVIALNLHGLVNFSCHIPEIVTPPFQHTVLLRISPQCKGLENGKNNQIPHCSFSSQSFFL